jgi:hypothetical protein
MRYIFLSLCLYFDGLSLRKLLNTSRFVNRSHTAIRTGYKNMNLKRYLKGRKE